MKKILFILLLIVWLFQGCAGAAKLQPDTPGGPLPADPYKATDSQNRGRMLPLVPGHDPDPLSAKDGVYTFCWISDTQYYVQDYPWIFQSMTVFLKNNAKRMNLEYIMHTGDVVNKMWHEEQWETAEECLENLKNIPLGLLAGNHDVQAGDVINYSEFQKRFGEDRTKKKGYFGGSYENNRGRYDLLEIGDTKFLFVYMGYAPDEACLRWINSIFEKYPDRAGFLLLHEYFDSNGELTDTGQLLFDQVVSRNSNLYMVLCGHRYNAVMRTDEFDDDGDGKNERTVHQMMANYQNNAWGGAGYMRFLQMDEENGEILVLTYSPYKDRFNFYSSDEYPEKDEFTISVDWLG